MLELPVVIPFSFQSEYHSEGDYVQLNCIVTKGDMPIKFSWYMNHRKLHPSMGVSVMNVGRQTSILIIQNIEFRHAGLYTCEAHNIAGRINETAELVVKGT